MNASTDYKTLKAELNQLREEFEALRIELNKYKYDHLTGLQGRRDFEVNFSKYFHEGDPFYLALVDINNLHEINRQQGYREGDLVIRTVATFLIEYFPGLKFRLGGDEFAILSTVPFNTNLKIPNATWASVSSTNYKNCEEMFNAVDEQIIKQKEKKVDA